MSTDAERNAIERLAQRCFHQCLWLPETVKHSRLRVTFATSSNFDDESLPVLLWVPPQFCSRYHISEMDNFAVKYEVRLVGADR